MRKHTRTYFKLLGKKLGMTQFFQEDGKFLPVTVVEVGPCTVIQKKIKEVDGYDAVQLGFDDKKKQRVIKPEAGHVKKAKTNVKRFVKELRILDDSISEYETGMVLKADIFEVGDKVDVTGTSKGKGFQGVIKRHNFSMPDATHNHEHFRHGGSIGCRTSPGKVYKGRKMAGQMGNKQVTTPNLEVVSVQAEDNIVLIKGAVPGSKNGYVSIKASVKGNFKKRPIVKEAPTKEAAAEETKAEATEAKK